MGGREDLQTVVAEFGRRTLGVGDLEVLAAEAVDCAVASLGAAVVILSRWMAPGRVRILAVRGPIALQDRGEYDFPPPGMPDLLGEGPLRVADWRGPGDLPRPVRERDAGMVSMLSVSVLVGGASWGRLTVQDSRPRDWSDSEVNFLVSLANVVAATAERVTGEATQAAVAQLGRFALECRDLDATMRRAVEVAAGALDVPASDLIRLVGPGRYRMVCGHGETGLARGQEVDAGAAPGPEPDTEPLRVDDWRAETRLVQPEHLARVGVVSGLSAALVLDGQPWGWLAVHDRRRRRWREVEVDFLRSLANILVAALERATWEAAQAAVAAFGRFALESRDLDATLERACETVRRVLDLPMCAVVRHAGHRRMRVLCAQGPSGLAAGQEFEVAGALQRVWGSADVLRVEDWATETRFPPPPAGSRSGMRSSLLGTLRVGGASWACVVAHDARPRHWREVEMDFFRSLVNVLAAAVERDAMEARLRERAQQLQKVLLPVELPAVEGVEFAARFVPSGGSDVGGDWYDVLSLPGGGTALVMGDVEGHDSTAAAIMGQVRTVLNTYAAEGYPPAEVLARTSAFVAAHTTRLVSCCYVELRAAQRTLTCVSAGHPPPLVLGPDGLAQEITLDPGVLLGVQEDPPYVEHTVLLPIPWCVALVTDGLPDPVERLARIRDVSASGLGVSASGLGVADSSGWRPGDLGVETLADLLVRSPQGGGGLRDDAALLLACLGGAAGAPREEREVVRSFGPYPAACVAARTFTGDVLEGWGLGELRWEATLVVSELVTNALVHTTSPIRLSLRVKDSGRLWIGVHDTSDRRIRQGRRRATPEAVSGRGLRIVAELSSAWGVLPHPRRTGKVVWCELPVPGAG